MPKNTVCYLTGDAGGTCIKARLTDKGLEWVEARHAESAEARPV